MCVSVVVSVMVVVKWKCVGVRSGSSGSPRRRVVVVVVVVVVDWLCGGGGA